MPRMTGKILAGFVVTLGVVFAGAERPKFESGYEVVQAEVGDTVELWCQATGEAPLAYEWFDTKDEIISPNDDSSMHISTWVNGSLLTIDNVQQKHDGDYMCTCSNVHGLSNKVYELTVASSGGNDTALIRNVRATKITATSVEFSLTAPVRVSAIEVKYIESRDAKYEKQPNAKYVTFRKGSVYEIKELISGGFYTFQFRPVPASNDDGNWTHDTNVTLLPSKPDVVLRYLAGNSLRIEWVRSIDDIMRDTTDKWQLRYYPLDRMRGNSWVPTKCTVTMELTSCLGSAYTIAGLFKSRYYEIELRAHTVSGFGEAHRSKVFIS